MPTAILDFTRSRMVRMVAVLVAVLALALTLTARPSLAQEPAATTAAAIPAAAAPGEGAAAAPAANDNAAAAPEAAPAPAATGPVSMGSYVPKAPVAGIGQPVDGKMDVQAQFSPTGRYAFGFHTALVWVMVIISVFVLGLLLYVMVRFRAKANPTPSRTTHNTLLEVVWTLVPVLVLVGIAIPSISLLSQQYRSPPKDAVTVKVTGNQWYWSYGFPDNGDFSFDSYMLNIKGEPEVNPGKRVVGSSPTDGPSHLEVDNRLVLPVGVPIRIQMTAADVIHSFAVPALWFKIDAVPGRLNERMLTIEKPGVYYGQCSELCGVKHGYMPIAIEAVPMAQWRDWVRGMGGSFPAEEAAAAPAATPAATPAGGAAPATPAASATTTAPASPAPAA